MVKTFNITKLKEQSRLHIFYKHPSVSTQDDARAGIEKDYPTPALYLADYQEQARGRFGRPFHAQKGQGIYMTLCLKIETDIEQMDAYTLLAASSLCKAIHRLTPLKPQIKWVNDIYLENKKIAGILTESIISPESGLVEYLLIGVGINFHITDFPDDLQDKAGSLFTQHASITREELILSMWQIFFDTPKQDLLKYYKDQSLVLDRTICFQQGHELKKALVLDITDKGELHLKHEDGQTSYLSSGEISLTSW